MIDARIAPAPVDLEPVFLVTAESVRSGALPSAVVGIGDATGIRAVRAFPGPADQATIESMFFLASVTKPIVATAVMQLVDEGRLDLRAPISQYVPGFGGPDKEHVTAWHVLTHTAGIADVDYDTLRRERPAYRRMVERVCAAPLVFAPGTRHAYASDSFYLLAEVISRLTGMGFADALHRRVLIPLGMADTTFDPRSRRCRLMPVHGVALGNPLMRELTLQFLARATLPGGGLFGTVEDLLRFGRALLPRRAGVEPGPRVLTQGAIEEMTRLQTAGIPEELEDGTLRDARYALGWRKPGTEWVPASSAAFMHGGKSGTRLWIDPARDLVFVFLSNEWGVDDGPMYATLTALYGAWGMPG